MISQTNDALADAVGTGRWIGPWGSDIVVNGSREGSMSMWT